MRPLEQQTITVFIVDDNETDIALLERSVTRVAPQAQVIHTTNPMTAQVMIDHFQPDIVFVDLRMLGIQGDALISDLRDKVEHTARPMVIWSNSTAADDVRLCYRQGASAYYVKPDSAAAYDDFTGEILHHWLIRASVNV